MRRSFLTLLVLALSLAALPAQAALTRVWVSGQGVDAPNCGALAAPCRQIKFVLDNGIVAPGGEIDIRDAAGFAPFTITHAVSIVNDGAGVASIQATSTSDAIGIKAGSADGVFLKGLTIDSAGVTDKLGINSISAGRLVVTRCTIKNVRIGIAVSTLIVKDIDYKISDVTIDNMSGAGINITQNNEVAKVAGEISRASISNSNIGVTIFVAKALLADVSITGSKISGVSIAGAGGNKPTVFLRRCTITNSGIGLDNQSEVFSYGDNSIAGNTVDIAAPASVTRLAPQ